MKAFDFSNKSLIDKYYREKFAYDMSNYFKVNGWRKLNYQKDYKVNTDTLIADLHIRGDYALSGEPAIYMGCGPWWNVEQNYEFSGMFAFMYIATKCICKYCGNEDAFLFCKTYTFPLIDDKQAVEDFDVVATLKEANIAPCKAEAENYLSMMDYVIPYMKEKTAEFFGKLDFRVTEEIDNRIEELRTWVMNTQDEILSFYGLTVRKEIMPEGSLYPVKYCLLDSLSWYSKRYDVYSFEELVKLGHKRSPFAFGDITEFDGPIVPHYEDFEYLKNRHKAFATNDDEDPFATITKQEERENMLYNIIINFMWDDESYDKDGKVGLKDCWGRVLVPAKYEACDGVHDSRFLTNANVCILIKKDGKWAMTRRNNEHEKMTDYDFDEINLTFQGYYVTRIDNKYGLFTPSGIELLMTKMDDIYSPTICQSHIMFKEDGKYGILYNNRVRTKQLLDEVTFDCGFYLSVRVGNEWGYLDKDGYFTRERKNAYIESNGFDADSMAMYRFGFNEEINLDECVTLEEMTENLKRNFNRFSVNIDLHGSCLEGKAEIKMGLRKRVLYYHLLPDGPTFCVDMQRPYQLKLQDDRYHDMQQSWEGFDEAKEWLKVWLNEANKKTGVRNWAELAYEFNITPCNANRPLSVSYVYRKSIDASKTSPNEIEHYDFPEIMY